MASNDITKDFIQRLKTNGANAESMATSFWDYLNPMPGKVVGETAVRWVWFYRKVRNGGPWDFKNNAYKAYRNAGVVLCGNPYRFDMPGNFHYGYVGAAAGFFDYTLFKGAGEAQKRARTSRPEYHCTYGDDPEDHEFIRLGILLYDTFKLNVDDVNLGTILSKFQVISCP